MLVITAEREIFFGYLNIEMAGIKMKLSNLHANRNVPCAAADRDQRFIRKKTIFRIMTK
jgi:hypothetical protein